MTIDELRILLDSSATEETWHRHPTGGGWVENTARVAHTAAVGPSALVFGRAQVNDTVQVLGSSMVYDQATLFDEVRVYGSARVHGWATVTGRARVYGEAHVYGNSHVGGRARVYGEAEIYGHAVVAGSRTWVAAARLGSGVWTESPFQVCGSRGWLYETEPGTLRVDRYSLRIERWLQRGREALAELGFDEEAQEEYLEYMRLFVTRRRRLAERESAPCPRKRLII